MSWAGCPAQPSADALAQAELGSLNLWPHSSFEHLLFVTGPSGFSALTQCFERSNLDSNFGAVELLCTHDCRNCSGFLSEIGLSRSYHGAADYSSDSSVYWPRYSRTCLWVTRIVLEVAHPAFSGIWISAVVLLEASVRPSALRGVESLTHTQSRVACGWLRLVWLWPSKLYPVFGRWFSTHYLHCSSDGTSSFTTLAANLVWLASSL